MMNDKLIYLAGPYSYNPDEAFLLHMNYAAAIIHRGFVVFSPIMHNHHLAKANNMPTDYMFWQRHNRKMVIRSDELWIMKEDGWETSKGTQYEIRVAGEYSKYIRHVSLEMGLLSNDLHVFDFVRG